MRKLLIGTVLVIFLLPTGATAGTYTIDRKSQWEKWTYPKGAMEIGEDGSLGLVWFRREIDPMLDAGDFEHTTRERGVVQGGARARSNDADARYLIDRDERTWWQPDEKDPLDQWWVELDFGRVVLLKKIRLVFGDTPGARPFHDFSVYVSEGAHVTSQGDLFNFTKVATTTRPNDERVLEYDLFLIDPGEAEGENLLTGDTLRFIPVQYVRFVPHAKTEDAALAEIEVMAMGDNIGLGTFDRVGSIRSSGKFSPKVPGLFDGTIDAYWNASAARAAEAVWWVGGQWFEWDLGVAFWLDEIVLLTWDPLLLGLSPFLAGSGQLGYDLFTSDGTPIPASGGEDRVRSDFDYERLSLVDNRASPRQWKFDHVFPRRKVRYLFYHHEYGTGRYGFNIFEAMLYGEGYPAEVDLTSGFIDLGNSKSIADVVWEADIPPGTRVEIRTKTGDTLEKDTLYYDKNGKRVSKEKWEKLPRAARGPTEETIRQGTDWSGWSGLYKVSGEAFRSPSPRQYVQLKVVLATDDPMVAPVLRSISLRYHDPLVKKGATGAITPREAEPGALEGFSYRIWPEYTPGDVGFDRVLIKVPSRIEDLSVEIDAEAVSASYTLSSDSLLVELPRHVTRDPVTIHFRARAIENPTVFDAFLLSSRRTGTWQGVKPAGTDATRVFLPAVAAGDDLIMNLALEPNVITPNEDGRNDLLTVSFDLVKVDVPPEVTIYDLRGRRMMELARQAEERQVYLWDGRDSSGEMVGPGIYVCRIRVEADIGTQTLYRVISVAY